MNYFRDFFRSASIVAGVIGTVIIEETWIGMRGVAFSLGVGVQDPNLWATTVFRFMVNGVPVLDYGNIADRIGSIDLMTPVKIDLPPYARITVECDNNGGSNSLFAARLQCRTIE
jgi:hypothetical protein